LRDQSFQSTPIGWAYHNHQSDVVDYLLQFASIFDALRCDGVKRVETLLNEDSARANAKDNDGTPLIFYLHPQLQHLARLVELLAGAGADFSAPNENGFTLAELAALQGWEELSALRKVHGGFREIS
jgi:ankyrin repeat protein